MPRLLLLPLLLVGLLHAEEPAGTMLFEPLPADELAKSIWLAEIGTKKIVPGFEDEPIAVVNIEKPGKVAWEAGMLSPKNTVAVKKGDYLIYALHIRSTGTVSELGEVHCYFESSQDKQNSGGRTILYPTTEWRTYRRSAIAEANYAPGELHLSVHLSPKAQELEIQSLMLESYPGDTPIEELPVDRITWEGIEDDAPWRAKAKKRIDQLRKADLTITVTDANGDPVPGATVHVEQQRHAWKFGTYAGPALVEDSPDGERYREEVLKRYSYLTVPAYLANWGWLSDDSRRRYFEISDWAQAHGIPARGHLLVYPGWTASPQEWFDLPKPELLEKLNAHIPRATRILGERGVTEWDVANELRMNEAFIEEIGGMEKVADWFKLAREHNPEGKLYLNETWILPNHGRTETEQSTLERHLDELIALDAPIDGIGLQGHFGNQMTSPIRVKEILDRFANKYDRDLLITEFDMNHGDKDAQAKFVRDFYTICFSHPNVTGIIQWGFWEKTMWKPLGSFFTTDWREMPAATMYEELVLGEWWTDVEGAAGEDGTFKVRAFKGEQEVTVTVGKYSTTRRVSLAEDAAIDVSAP